MTQRDTDCRSGPGSGGCSRAARSRSSARASARTPSAGGWPPRCCAAPASSARWLVNPGRDTVLGQPCLPSLADVPEPVDLVLLGVPDQALVDQVRLASARGDGGAVVFGAGARAARRAGRRGGRAGDLRRRLHGLRQRGPRGARDRVPRARPAAARPDRAGDALRARCSRRCCAPTGGWSTPSRSRRARSWSPRPPTTSTYALSLPETRVVGLVLETLRDADHHARGARRRRRRGTSRSSR